MKRILLVTLAVIGLYSANAQRVDRTIGVRLGNGYATSVEFSYQHPLAPTRRLEFDASSAFGTNWVSIGATGLHQWVFNIENGFQWYLGIGASIGNTFTDYEYYDYYNGYGKVKNERQSYFTMALNPNGGVEYCFKNIPLQLAVDARPNINLLNVDQKGNDIHLLEPSIGVCARYIFK